MPSTNWRGPRNDSAHTSPAPAGPDLGSGRALILKNSPRLPDVQKWQDETHVKVLPDPLHTKESFIR